MAQAHFNWTELLPGVEHAHVHVATGVLTGVALVGISLAGRVSLGRGPQSVRPSGVLSLKGFFELFIEFIIGLIDLVIGEKGHKFAPMFAAIFLYIWISNLIGLIPGMTPSTDNINTTFALGVFSFVVYNIYGFREHGLSYLKHFLGPVMFIAPFMLFIELISHMIRPLSLGLRLQGNMMADHTILSVFIDLFSGFWFIPVPAIFYGLGLFVSTMQAFVFTILSMIYVSLAISHDH